MNNKKMNNTRQQQEQFTSNCLYLGLKLLAQEYPQMIDRANKNTVGHSELLTSCPKNKYFLAYCRKQEKR